MRKQYRIMGLGCKNCEKDATGAFKVENKVTTSCQEKKRPKDMQQHTKHNIESIMNIYLTQFK